LTYLVCGVFIIAAFMAGVIVGAYAIDWLTSTSKPRSALLRQLVYASDALAGFVHKFCLINASMRLRRVRLGCRARAVISGRHLRRFNEAEARTPRMRPAAIGDRTAASALQ
jgi:hypothetical protein